MLRLFSLLVALALGASVAMAQQKHPRDIATIDAALKKVELSETDRARVVRLRNEGQKLHNNGKHGEAEVVLEKAKAILKKKLR